MLQVSNETPFTAALFVFPDPRTGVDTAYVTVKATFELAERGVRLSSEQLPIVPADEAQGAPDRTSLRAAGEAHPCKPATDVLLVGSGYAPGGRPAPHFAVSLTVGPLRKVVHVFGDRTWHSGALGAAASPPQPATEIPLRWERAYGGRVELEGGGFVVEPRNPVGVGLRGKRSAAEMNGTPLPNLENPREPITGLSSHPAPAGFGPIAPSWAPRATLCGTYDERWRRTRAPYFPADFDPRFFQCAPPDQIYPGRLQGGEPVEILNGAPSGVQRFTLPTVRMKAELRVASERRAVALGVETLLLEPDQLRFSLLWRGASACDKQLLRIQRAALSLEEMRGVLG